MGRIFNVHGVNNYMKNKFYWLTRYYIHIFGYFEKLSEVAMTIDIEFCVEECHVSKILLA